jgi:hypothetical protein
MNSYQLGGDVVSYEAICECVRLMRNDCKGSSRGLFQ